MAAAVACAVVAVVVPVAVVVVVAPGVVGEPGIPGTGPGLLLLLGVPAHLRHMPSK